MKPTTKQIHDAAEILARAAEFNESKIRTKMGVVIEFDKETVKLSDCPKAQKPDPIALELTNAMRKKKKQIKPLVTTIIIEELGKAPKDAYGLPNKDAPKVIKAIKSQIANVVVTFILETFPQIKAGTPVVIEEGEIEDAVDCLIITTDSRWTENLVEDCWLETENRLKKYKNILLD